MGSTVISEVLNDTPPWSSMIDTRSHRSDQTPYDISASYHPNPATQTQPHRRSASQSSRATSSSTPTSTARHSLQSSRPAPRITPTSTPSQDAPVYASVNSSSTPSHAQHAASAPPPNPQPDTSTTSRQHMSSDSPRAHTGPLSGSQTDSSSSSPQPAGGSLDSPLRIKVKDLKHIQSFAVENSSAASSAASDQGYAASPQYEISDMPIGDIIEMVAGLLTKITATNDQHYEHLHRQIPPPEAAANLSSQTSSVLAFHGKNVPSITILSYLSRIHKYCPATWEVFLSLLVYFDRMTERVNAGPIQSLRQADQEFIERSNMESHVSNEHTELENPSSSNEQAKSPTSSNQGSNSPDTTAADSCNLSHFFVVDSFNIHRLVIAGVTCAAKYFSDIFFTNSRYAKVGGLPLMELNNLELQFLVLNDFRLAVPVEELEAYATMLVEFYAREIVAQHQNDKSEGIEMVTR